MFTYWDFILSILNFGLWWIYDIDLDKVGKLTLCWFSFVTNSDLIDARCAQPFGLFSFANIHFFRKPPKQTNIWIGRDDICEALLKYTHLPNLNNETFHNDTVNTSIKYLLAMIYDNKVVKRKEHLYIIFNH